MIDTSEIKGHFASVSSLLRSPRDTAVQTYLGSSMQVADILQHILSHVGPSEVWQSTFSVSEEFLRRFWHIRRKGLVTRATVLLDHKACRKILKLWPFISKVYDEAFMADNHSKLILVRSRQGDTVSAITSQNLTRGNRTESTVIVSMPVTFASLLESFRGICRYRSVPLDDLLPGRSRSD